jgi:CHAD domain-containing protein
MCVLRWDALDVHVVITHELRKLWLSLDVVNEVNAMTTLWAVYQQGHLKYTGKNLCLNGRSRYNIVDIHKMKIPIRSNGKLTEHGYHDVRDKSELARHRALGKVIRAGEPPLGLFRRLNVLMILFKRTDPKLSKLFKADRDWVKKIYM